MYSGSITAWNDPALAALNPGVRLPGSAVVPVHRSDASGDTFLFTSYLAAGEAAWSRAAGYGTTVAWPGRPAGGRPAAETRLVTDTGRSGSAALFSQVEADLGREITADQRAFLASAAAGRAAYGGWRRAASWPRPRWRPRAPGAWPAGSRSTADRLT
jgi:hypothetical protein